MVVNLIESPRSLYPDPSYSADRRLPEEVSEAEAVPRNQLALDSLSCLVDSPVVALPPEC